MDGADLCLDTSALIAYLRGREPGATAVDRAIREQACYVTAVTVYELLLGVAQSQRQIGEDRLLSVLRVAPLDEATARRAATLHVDLLRRGEDVGVKDVIIAATCLERSLPRLTLNARHFARAPGLKVFDPASFLSS